MATLTGYVVLIHQKPMNKLNISDNEVQGNQDDINQRPIVVPHNAVPQLKSIINHRGIHMTMNALKAFKMFKEPLYKQKSDNLKL